jgi:serine/threonine-protein kinase
MPSTGAAGSAYDRMFVAEARIASELQHPHVCGVFDYGCAEDKAYMAMEYASGRSLLDIFRAHDARKEPLRAAGRIARVLADVCEGLHAIHQQHSVSDGPLGLVHRDISPDNVILTFDGFAKIIDLGLVKTEQRGDKTEPGFVKGKISYVAPELLGGDSATAQADVWSLGVVAWELLTGQRLFHEATDIATLRKVIDHQILAPSAVVAGLPQELDAVILRALSRDTKHRYASALDFAAALWSFLAKQERMVQHADLAAWMDELFPEERKKVELLLHSLSNASATGEPLVPARSGTRPLPKMANLLRRIRSQSSASLRSVPLRPRALASVGIAFVLGVLALASQLGLSRPSSALSLNPANGQSSATAQPTSYEIVDSPLAPSGFVVNVERSAVSSDLVLRIRAPRAGQVPSPASSMVDARKD